MRWKVLLLCCALATPAAADVTLLDDGRWLVNGVVDAAAPQIQVRVDDTPAGAFAALDFRYEGEPVLVLRGDGSVEPMLPGGVPGATAVLGRYWDCEAGLVGPLRFVGIDLPATSKKSGRLDLRGQLSNLDSLVSEKLRIRIRPPKPDRLRLEFRYRLRTTRQFCIDQDRRDTEEEFRVVELLASYLSPSANTNDLVRYVKRIELDCDFFDCDEDKVNACAALANETGYVFEGPRRLRTRRMALFHTSNTPAPSATVEIELRKPHSRHVKPQGFVTASSDPADRNVAVWADWVEVRGRYGEDRKVANFRFALELEPPRQPGCDRFED
ncbi:MAG: hypothetical protein ABFS41_12940 [Myxococcota bacterium]